MVGAARKYRRRASHAYELYRSRKLLWPMLRDALKGKYRFSLFTMLAILLCIAYILFPFDFLPDFIPFIGWLDDGALFWLMLQQLKKETVRYDVYHKLSAAIDHKI